MIIALPMNKQDIIVVFRVLLKYAALRKNSLIVFLKLYRQRGKLLLIFAAFL